jgi:hypothetical protein
MIDYGIIQASIEHYEGHGFKRVESPWTIAETISGITKPEWAANFTVKEKNKVLVASGEQGFLAMYNKGFLPKGKFQTVTPCFRDDTFTPIHTKYFIKNELIATDDTSLHQLKKMVDAARDFFRQYCLQPKFNDGYVMSTGERDDVVILVTVNGRNVVVDEVNTSDPYRYPSYDLMYRGIELGSYGIRHCSFLTWIYGTGVAEPRLTRVLKTYGVSQKKNR